MDGTTASNHIEESILRTCCPYLGCQLIYSVEQSARTTVCPACNRRASFRSPQLLEQIHKHWLKRKESEQLTGGPAGGSEPSFSVILEDIRSLWNVGSIFRSADGAGFSNAYLCGITGCPPRKEITKTSLGAEEAVSWQYCRSVLEAKSVYLSAQTMVIGLESTSTSVPLSEFITEGKGQTPLAIIVGNEVNGLSPEALSICDHICHLPMRGIKESLNVAVAFGIAAYMLTGSSTAGLPLRGEIPASQSS